MPSTTQRYPLSTPDGKYIPLDVVRSAGYAIKSVNTSVSSPITIGENVEIISFSATEDMLVCFGGVAALPADAVVYADTVFIGRGQRVTVAATALTFTAIALTTAGILHCQLIDKWAGLGLQTQYLRK